MPIASTISFPSRDGTNLVGDWYLTDNPRGTCIIVHGYAEHAGRYAEVAEQLNQAGIDAFAFDVRGHGRSGGRRGHCRHFAEYLEDFDAAYAKVAAHAKGGAIIVVGHSNGSLIVLRALCRTNAEQPTAAIVSSPFLALKLPIPRHTRIAGEIASRVWPSLAFPNKLVVEDLTRDPDKQEARRRDTLCNSVATARWFTEAMDAQAYVEANASQIAVPTCWLVAGDDPIADPAASRRIAGKLRAPREFHDLAGFRHEVFNELDRQSVFSTMLAFVKQQVP